MRVLRPLLALGLSAAFALGLTSYLIWQYTGGATSGMGHGTPTGSLVLDGASTYGKPWPLPPGEYEVLYLVADTYRDIAKARFRVTG